MLNMLRPSGFRFRIEELPEIAFTGQQVTLPGLSLGSAMQATPYTDLKQPGDKLMFEELQVTFPIDEEMKNYKEIYRWMVGLGFPQSRKQFGFIKAQLFETSRMDLILLNSEDQSQEHFVFHGGFPTSLQAVPFDISITTMEPIPCTATFAYSWFEFSTDVDLVGRKSDSA